MTAKEWSPWDNVIGESETSATTSNGRSQPIRQAAQSEKKYRLPFTKINEDEISIGLYLGSSAYLVYSFMKHRQGKDSSIYLSYGQIVAGTGLHGETIAKCIRLLIANDLVMVKERGRLKRGGSGKASVYEVKPPHWGAVYAVPESVAKCSR